MQMKTSSIFRLLIMAMLLAACNLFHNGSSVSVPTSIPTVPPETCVPDPLDADWNDRSVFEAGLMPGARSILENLTGASIYHIDLQITNDYRTVIGREQILYTNQEDIPLGEIYLRLFANVIGGRMEISNVSVDGVAVEPSYESANSAARLLLDHSLQPGAQAVVAVEFNVQVPTDLGGSYGLLSYLNGVLALDSVYPSIPAFGPLGWYSQPPPQNADLTFNDAAFYLVRVTAPVNLTLVASGSEVEREAIDDTQVVLYALGPGRDFYIAGSEDYEKWSLTTSTGVVVNSYAPADLEPSAQLALETARDAIEIYTNRFGAYPYSEFDVAGTTMLALGIEYPGMTGISIDLYDPNATLGGTPSRVYLQSATAHEVGHQWFYNAVGDDQIHEPWLDESITQYITGLYYLDSAGQGGYDDYQASWYSRWDRVDRHEIPIGLPADLYQGSEYSAIVYGRGPLFLEALSQEMGRENFNAFLEDYYSTYLWDVATTEGFKRMAEEHCSCDLTLMFEEWVYGPKP